MSHQGVYKACNVFEPRTDTGSVLFSYFACLHTATFIFLSLFALVEIISLKVWERPKCPGLRNVHFRLPSVAQKRSMLKLSIKNVSSSCRILINFLLYCSLFSNNCGNVLLCCICIYSKPNAVSHVSVTILYPFNSGGYLCFN